MALTAWPHRPRYLGVRRRRYILPQIVHDRDDAQAVAILASCRRAMREASCLLVVEGPPG